MPWSAISKAVEIFALIVILAVVPALSYVTVKRLEGQSIPRLALYFSAVLSLWLLAVVAAVALFVTGTSPAEVGFRPVPLEAFGRWTLLLWAVVMAAMAGEIVLERRGWWWEDSPLMQVLLPETLREKLWAVLILSPTAALCEEFVYRGYLLTWLMRVTGLGWLAVAISSAAFGAAHFYQGVPGMLRAAVFGALLAYPVLVTGSLFPSMAAHFLIDAVALGWLGPRFLARKPAA
jgi:membrane protease YdiL (CAAX protease family)